MPRSFRLTTLALALSGLLYACGGSDHHDPEPTPEPPPAPTPAPEPPPAPEPEAKRPHDSRVFVVDEAALPFEPLADAPATSRWWGVLDKAGYRIEVPENWNGMLVMYAHGYNGTEAALTVTSPVFRRFLIENGYAWAASSYSANFYDVRAGVEDTNQLALKFNELAEKHGRKLNAPSKVYITGHSMGGHVTAAAIDAEAQRTAVNKVRYDGAVPMCGVMADTELYNYFAAYQLAAQHLSNQPAPSWPATNWAQVAPQVQQAMFTQFPQVPTAQGLILKNIVANLTGGTRPIFDHGYAQLTWQGAVWTTFGDNGTIAGILNEGIVSTEDIVYQFDDDPAQSAEEAAFNAQIMRAKGEPEANRLRRDGLRWIPLANAEFDVPVVSLHTLGDVFVPFSMQQGFKKRAIANGTDGLLVQRAIRSPGHCDFTVAEQAAALEAMFRWEQEGIKPEGDEVLDRTVVADPAYGCRFTDNTVDEKAGDNPLLALLRASLPACPVPEDEQPAPAQG